VFTVGPDSIAHEHKVEVGIRHGDQVQILSGLSAGDRVVTIGGLGLEDGAKVQIEKAEAAGGESAAEK
jgi:multidrug efflux pump subunit AcrA (membrane-fusion protein)